MAYVLQDPAGGGIINVFLPKSVQLLSGKIQRYNQHEADPVNLIFRGMSKRSFIRYSRYDFEYFFRKYTSLFINYDVIGVTLTGTFIWRVIIWFLIMFQDPDILII